MEKPSCREALTDENIRKKFEGADDFVVRTLRLGQVTLTAYFIDGLTAGGDVSEYVFKPLYENQMDSVPLFYESALTGGVYNSNTTACTDLNDAAVKLVNGFCVVLFPGVGAIACEVKGGQRRSPASPEVENTVKGPKDAFVETIRTNTTLIRRHLRTPDLRLKALQVGRRSLTNVTIAWIHGLTDSDLVKRMEQRLSAIDIDGFVTPAAVEEYVTGSRMTAFPLIQYTERTDKFCQGLLDGRVGLIVDGLPLAYLAPGDLGYFMESPEDRGRDYITASSVRVLRYVALVLDLLLPGVYIALATFCQELIPLPLLRAIIDSKAQVPFTTVTEVLALLIAFELLQESGVHLPQAVGQSVSVVGGIVVGSAAVEAGLISPVALITVSVAGVCGFVLPNRDFAEAVRVWRFVIALFAAFAGLWGCLAGVLILIIHLSGLKSMGLPYLSSLYSRQAGGLLRLRLKNNKYRNPNLHPQNRRNQK